MNGIKFTNLKQIIEFMYHGEVKVIEEELESLLALAESFKVKGLSNVRNKKLIKETENGNNTKKRKHSTESDDVSIRWILKSFAFFYLNYLQEQDVVESCEKREDEEPVETPETKEVKKFKTLV